MATDKNTTKDGFDYDLAVIGGGSGGLACAKMAAACGAKTVVFDFVKPSTQGTVWGLGGTCVNVGCVPKYLFHHTALLGQALHWDAPHMGWIDEQEGREQEAKKEDEEKKQGERNNGNEDDGKKSSIRKEVKWETCVQAVQNYIKSLNFSYRTGLRKAGVTYVNGLVKFKSAQELQYTLRSGE
ncbi:thioredoxin reductase, partial [Cystoisospora suis]